MVTQATHPVVVNKKIPENLKALKRDQGKLEQTMLDLQTKKHGLEARLSTPLPHQEITELGVQLKKIDAELASHEEQWLTMSEQSEAAAL